jgi:hypothetical protein
LCEVESRKSFVKTFEIRSAELLQQRKLCSSEKASSLSLKIRKSSVA